MRQNYENVISIAWLIHVKCCNFSWSMFPMQPWIF